MYCYTVHTLIDMYTPHSTDREQRNCVRKHHMYFTGLKHVHTSTLARLRLTQAANCKYVQL